MNRNLTSTAEIETEIQSEQSSSEESEKEDIQELKTSAAKCGDYIITYLVSKQIRKYFIAVILQKTNGPSVVYSIKFLKKVSESNGKLNMIYPDEDDVSSICEQEIVQLLAQPDMSRRQQYVFNFKKIYFKIE